MKNTIMIVDDDEIFLEELGEVLDSSGYKMVVTNKPADVIETAKLTRPSLILMDIKMPGKSGLEIAYDLRYVPELAEIPIIAMSAFFSNDNIPLIKLCGIQKVIKKPFNPLDIIWEIENALKKLPADEETREA